MIAKNHRHFTLIKRVTQFQTFEISAAAIALVTLRKGAGAGLWLFMWALLPAGTLVYLFGDSGPLLLLAGTMALALVLRTTVNLSLAVLVAACTSSARSGFAWKTRKSALRVSKRTTRVSIAVTIRGRAGWKLT